MFEDIPFLKEKIQKERELWRTNKYVKCPLCGKNWVKYRDFICKECMFSREDFER